MQQNDPCQSLCMRKRCQFCCRKRTRGIDISYNAFSFIYIFSSWTNLLASRREQYAKYLGKHGLLPLQSFFSWVNWHPVWLAVFIYLSEDEIDALATSRNSSETDNGSSHEGVLTSLLNEMDGVQELTGVTVVAATNRTEVIVSLEYLSRVLSHHPYPSHFFSFRIQLFWDLAD